MQLDKSINNNLYGFGIYKNWHCRFPLEQLSLEITPVRILIPEARIDKLIQSIDIKNFRILELGCLEGLHSLILHMLGAQEIIAIEGRKENFLKCLIVKNAFNLNRCKFLFGDINEILPFLSGGFDLCLALGIIYHLENPLSVIFRISQLADALYVWTHYSTLHYPPGDLVEVEYRNKTYKGKYVGENRGHYLSGLHSKSFWIFEDDILKAVLNAGFKDIKFIEKEEHENGPAMTFLARK